MLGSTPEIVERRARVLIAVAKKSGSVSEIAKKARREDLRTVREDLGVLVDLGHVVAESHPKVYRLP